MRNWSISLGRYLGVEFRMHVAFLFLPAFVWLTEPPGRGAAGLGRGLALVGLVLASVFVRELIKASAGLRARLPLRGVILLPIGAVALTEDHAPAESGRAGRDLSMALVGPLVSLLLAVLGALAALTLMSRGELLAGPHVHSTNLLRSFVWINVYLMAVNLLPAYPLDGGRLLRAMFARHTELAFATKRALAISQWLALFLMFAGIWNIWLMLVGVVLFLAGHMEERALVFQSVMEKVLMEDVMLTEFATLSPADTLEDALHKAVHSLQDDFPVVRGSDMVGVISRQRILDALRAQGNGYVQAAMSKVFEVAERKESLGSAFRKLTRKGLTIIPVVDEQRLVGIVTLQNLMHSISLLAESKQLRRAAE